ncbi:hypothetical protein [Sphingomonas bacterium]|uniref:hypothetical protein n=1 Tax=Sphingomonas bacterium TaxID=1895847 RepID=UPI0020C66E96|nr:hypothetical protein [Sphingomonas bacterium]
MLRAAGLLFLAAATAPAGAPPVTGLKPIVLHPGINRVPGFLAGGGTATIVQAWRGNGNAHGYTVWTVLGGPSEGSRVGLVGFETPGAEPVRDTIRDEPFDGERVLGAVQFATGQFATGRLRGRPVTLVITADLNQAASGVLADHATATVRWYRLDHAADAFGRPTDDFLPIGSVTTTKRYCNAWLAMRDVAGIRLRGDFAGPNRVDGCF